ncbi:unnamed protein product [Caenorhabditis bovis]|nr:unnamed protein product [Caenorhabditis bovis]
MHGGNFSDDLNTFTYYDIPSAWIGINDLDEWRAIDLSKCDATKNDEILCKPDAILHPAVTLDNVENFSALKIVDSGDPFFALARKLGATYSIATRVDHGSLANNGNFFNVQPLPIPDHVFHLRPPKNAAIAIGHALIKP